MQNKINILTMNPASQCNLAGFLTAFVRMRKI